MQPGTAISFGWSNVFAFPVAIEISWADDMDEANVLTLYVGPFFFEISWRVE